MSFSSRIGSALAILLGLFASGYLLFVYVTHGPIVCGVNGGCEIVRASKWARVGPIPTPFFGVVFYFGMLALLVARLAAQKGERPLYWLMRVGAVVGFLESVSLFCIQWLVVKAFCVWCLISGASATVIFLLSWFDQPLLSDQQKQEELKTIFAAMLVWMGASILGFWWLTR
jgi:uncharacterized membrane protein